MSFNTIPEILDDIRAGRMVVILDDEDRENEGDLIMAAQMVRPEDISIASTAASVSDGGLRWSGRIAHTIFRGPTRSIFVETAEGRLNVDAPAFGGYSVGDNVTVVVPQSAAWAVVDQGEAI